MLAAIKAWKKAKPRATRWPLGGTKHLPSTIAVLEKGTILTVSRIYIRQGASAFDSVTFRIAYAPKDPNRIKPDPNAAEGSTPTRQKAPRNRSIKDADFGPNWMT